MDDSKTSFFMEPLYSGVIREGEGALAQAKPPNIC
jgi:hypothetical protein